MANSILIIAGNSANPRDWASFLSIPGCRVRFAESVEEALSQTTALKPSLIVVDTSNVEEGLGVIRQIRRSSATNRTPTLLVINDGDSEAASKALEAGADDVLEQPFDGDHASSRIRRMLHLARLRRIRAGKTRIGSAEAEIHRHRQQLEILSRRLLQAQEEERRAIARELHDEVGQILTVLKINLVLAHRGLHDSKAPERISESIDLVDRLIGQVRDLWRTLRPALLDDLGLPAALHVLIDSAARRTGIHMELESDTDIGRLAPDHEITCYRVVQESLTNIIRHARAKSVRVLMNRVENSLLITINDDGVGFDVDGMLASLSTSDRMGLLGMRERISLIGGGFQIRSKVGDGTQIRISLPYEAIRNTWPDKTNTP